jgi:hypothetical protein
MKVTIERIEAGKLLPEVERSRLGLSPTGNLSVVIETLDDEEISATEMSAAGGAFAHLADEPDLYSDSDLRERNEAFLR